jgi:hypothetical protein
MRAPVAIAVARRVGGMLAALALVLPAGCQLVHDRPTAGHPSAANRPPARPAPATRPVPTGGLPGMPPPLQAGDVYAADRPNRLAPTVRHLPPGCGCRTAKTAPST